MKQTMSSVFSEIFVNNLFELNSYACWCEKETKNLVPGEPPETTLKCTVWRIVLSIFHTLIRMD